MIRPRSIRSRLIVTYTAAAMLLAVSGLVLFAALLHRGAISALDASLRARSAPIVAGVNLMALPPSGAGIDRPDQPDASGVPATVDSFAAVYGPAGNVSSLQPAGLRRSPLSKAQVAAARSQVRHIRLASGDEQVRVLAVPARTPAGTWVVAVGSSLAPVTNAADGAVHQLEVAVPILILLAAFGAWVLSGAALRPVERMRADAAELGEHDPANRLSVPATGDEVAHLAVTFNALLDRLQRSLVRQRDLIADAGHELRTPLSVLRIELELADDPGATRDDLADSVAHARLELDRLSKLADDLLFLAQADSASPIVTMEQVDVVAVAEESARASRAGAGARDIRIDTVARGSCVAQGDPAALRRALDNLVANALAASARGGIVRIETAGTEAGVTVAVSDTGPGFPEHFLGHAFERFARPDGARSSEAGGAGLGLAIVAEIVAAHHGTVVAENNDGEGATVTIAIQMPHSAAGAVPPFCAPGR